jgi:hypothetical protein
MISFLHAAASGDIEEARRLVGLGADKDYVDNSVRCITINHFTD